MSSCTLTVKGGFDLSEFARKLAFNVPVVEKTAPCEECYKETPIADMVSGLCPECVEKRIVETDMIPCHTCGRWHYADDMATEEQCYSCHHEAIADLKCHNMMEA